MFIYRGYDNMDTTRLDEFLKELEQLLDKCCTEDWWYKFDVEDGVSINLSIPKFKGDEDDNS